VPVVSANNCDLHFFEQLSQVRRVFLTCLEATDYAGHVDSFMGLNFHLIAGCTELALLWLIHFILCGPSLLCCKKPWIVFDLVAVAIGTICCLHALFQGAFVLGLLSTIKRIERSTSGALTTAHDTLSSRSAHH
jgi:hypothetical protein